MNVVKVFHELIKDFNDVNKCGLCWEFIGAGRMDYFNNLKLRDDKECCVYVGLLSTKIKAGYKTENEFTSHNYCDYYIRLFAGIPSRLDIQYYNENPSYPISESKWEKYINPIMECFGCGVQIDLCKPINGSYEITSWEVESVVNQTDYNFDGIFINAVFREYVNNN